jgi:hypothetical protein
MKKIRLLSALTFMLMVVLVTFAQCKKETSNNADYLRLISNSKQWFVTFHTDSCRYACTFTELYSIENDTVINNVTYKNIYLSRGYEFPQNKILYGQARETDDKKVYLLKGGKEKLYYDFGMKILDTITNWQLVKIDTVNFYGQNRKKYEFKSICTNATTYWIEGIGNINGLFYEDNFGCAGDITWNEEGGATYELNCVEEKQSTIFKSELYDDCWVYQQ